MKLAKLLRFFVIICAFSNLLSAQTALNLENGFKPWGSYDSSNFDSVDLETGNLILHAPIIPDYPQRGGKLKSQLRLYVSSHNWMMSCRPNSQGMPSGCAWKGGGTGVGIEYVGWLSVQRTITITVDPNFGSQYSVGGGYSLSTWDGATHQLYDTSGGTLSSFVTMDATGYQVAVSNPDQNGIPQTVVVTDRQGTQHVGTFGPSRCSDPAPAAPRPAGGYARVYDQWMTSPSICVEHSLWQYDVDANGNVRSLAPPLMSSTPPLDTMGRPAWGLQGSVVSDSSGCAGSVPYANSYSMQYVALGGAQNPLKVCYGTLPIQTAFGITGIAEYQAVFPGVTANVITTIILPNGTRWVFNYDSYGNVTSISLPTGGSISYSWDTLRPDIAPVCAQNNPWHPTPAIRVIKQRSLTDNNGHTSTWTYNWGTVQADNSVRNWVTGPSGNDTVHAFTMFPGSQCTTASVFRETTTQFWQGAKDSGTLLKQIDTSYGRSVSMGSADEFAYEANGAPTDIKTTVYPANRVSLVHRDYDSAFGASGPMLGNVVSEKVYDWGLGSPGPLLRETDTVYQWQKNSAYLSADLIDLPASLVVISPTASSNTKSSCPVNSTTNAACMSEIDYLYDENSPQVHLGTPLTGTLVSPPSSVRGNLTTTNRWLSTSNNFISSTNVWFDTGMLAQTADPLGHITTYSYDPSETYVVKTCNQKNQCVYGSYDFNTGSLMTFTDVNGSAAGDAAHTTSYNYETLTGRIASALDPPDPGNNNVRAQTSFVYSDVTSPNVFPLTVTRTHPVTTALTDSSTTTYDGLGRSYKAEHSMPSGSPATTITTYDEPHDQLTVTNPYFSVSDSTYGSTTSLSDALGRASQVTEQDGSVRSTHFSVITGINDLAPGTASLGDCNDSFDEVGKERRSCTDALGRLVEVDEQNPGASAVAATGSVSISGSEQSATSQPGTAASINVTIGGSDSINILTTCTPNCHIRNVADAGTISFSVNVGGTTIGSSVNYGGASTPASLATALYSAFPANSFVTMSNPNGTASFTLTANVGSSGNSYILSAGSATGCMDSESESCGGSGWSMTLSGPNLTPTTASTANLTGGQNASTNPDAGTVTVTLNGTAYQTSYGATDDAASIATRLAGLITAGSWANADASGGTINLTSKTPGASVNYSLAASYTYNSSVFAHPSFTTALSGSRLAGGYNATDMDNHPYQTLYSYDALGTLLRVEQHGNTTDSTQWRIRTFTYDSLSRLLTANNPESGAITYSYDADGNLLQKTSPAPNQTSTATQTVSYCYDELHRVTGKGYGAQTCPLATPVVTYTYDSGTNAIGKLTSLTDQAGTASYTYDVLGRLAAETRTLTGANNASISKNLSYSYNLNGSLKTLTYPSGNVVTYTPDSAGRMLSAIDSGNSINYVTGATYGPDSALTGFISGYSTSFAGITNAFSYNKRLQPLNMSANAPGQTVFSIGYDFHVGNGISGADNGNVFGITNYKDTTRSQAFTYDALNRLASAQNAGTDCTVNVLGGNKKFWGNTYSYDAWGNLLNKTKIGTACAGENLSLTADAHNWIHATGGSDYLYDAAGNMTFNATPPTQNYSYDSENRLTGAAGYAYTYDGDGNRVRKSNSSTGTLYWYMTPGIVGESDLSGNLTDEYVFFDGERVARKSTNGVFYYFADHLKTASVITDASGNITSESDFYPWGGELQFVANDSNHYKFTGKERDSETQLDYFGARYYSNGLGRWVSADWSPTPIPIPYADLGDPQSLNLYGFVGGNPASKADPDGHFPVLALAGGGALVEFGGPVLASNPVGWTILGLAAVGTIGYVAYEHFHGDKAQPKAPDKAAPAGAVPGTQTKADTQPVVHEVDPVKTPQAADHVRDAQAKGQPKVVTVGSRADKAARRNAALKGVPVVEGKHRNEYPPAWSAEGGQGADVRHIDPPDNMSDGGSMGQTVKDLPEGTKVEIKIKDTPK